MSAYVNLKCLPGIVINNNKKQHMDIFFNDEVSFKQNGISHYFQLEQSISALRNVGWYFSFYSNFNRAFCKRMVETLIRRRIMRAASGQALHYSTTSHKKDARLILVTYSELSHK